MHVPRTAAAPCPRRKEPRLAARSPPAARLPGIPAPVPGAPRLSHGGCGRCAGAARLGAAPGAPGSPLRLGKCLVPPHLSASAAALPAGPRHFYRSGEHVFPSPLQVRYFHISSVIIRLFKRGGKRGKKKRGGDAVARWLEAVLKLPALKNLSAKFRPIVSGFPLIPCCN